jgi:hypothetical protein
MPKIRLSLRIRSADMYDTASRHRDLTTSIPSVNVTPRVTFEAAPASLGSLKSLKIMASGQIGAGDD